MKTLFAIPLAVLGLFGFSGGKKAGPPAPHALVADPAGTTLYVACSGANRVAVVDAAAGKHLAERDIAIGGSPAGMACDGRRLLVCSAEPAGELVVVTLPSGKVARRIPVGHTPTAVALSPDGNTAYVANRFNGSVSVVDLVAGKEKGRVEVGREPVALAVTPDGRRLFVANHLPSSRADEGYIAATVTVVDLASGQVAAKIKLPNGSTSLRGLCISPDGKHVYVTHILARYQLPTTQLERGWMNTNAMTILDAAGMRAINTVLLDEVDLGAANPWGVGVSPDGATICVAHSGTHEVSVIDRKSLHERLDKAAAGQRVTEVSSRADDVPNDLAFLLDVRRRVKLPGNGPRGLVVLADRVAAAEYFTDDVAFAPLAADAPPSATSAVRLGPATEKTIQRRGEMYFHDAAFCFQHWQSCASCHPDGRADSLNWDLLNDGLGNPKQTKNMLYAHVTPPAMISGVRTSAEYAVRSGLRFIQFSVRPEEDAVAIDEYMKSLRPVPSPFLENGRPSKSALRGKKIFVEAGCAECHTGPYFTDMKQHEIGLGKGLDTGHPLDTPALNEGWRTAPYLHDGRAVSLFDMMDNHNLDNRHGSTMNLTEPEMKDLEAYLLTL
jgi:YVTN family beta-propeller protein